MAVARKGKVELECLVRFHNTIAAVIVHLCSRLRQAVHLNQVCLSGGTFPSVRRLGAHGEPLGSPERHPLR